MQKHQAIGIMDQAYFVPKKQILLWINKTLNLDVPVIEDLGTGSVYCQLLDIAFGQRVPMHKVNWKAKFQYEFINNLKVFQQAMQKIGINKKIDIQKLAKAKYQDNLQLIQWLKRFIQLSGNILQDYKPEQRRNNCQLYSITTSKKALNTSFKTNTSTSFMTSSSTFMNSSICSTARGNGSNKPSGSNYMNSSLKPKISNKENHFHEDSKGVAQKLDKQMNQIKKILLGSQQAEDKLIDIHKIVFGVSNKVVESSHLMEIQAVESDDEVLVF